MKLTVKILAVFLVTGLTVLAQSRKIHRALAFQTGITVVGRSGFGLYAYGGAAVRFKGFE